MQNNSTIKKLLSSFFSSLIQFVAYGIIYIIYIECFLFILGDQRQIEEWVGTTVEIIIPALSFIAYCILMLRKKFHFSIKNIINIYAIIRLFVRLLAPFCFLCLGYFVSMPGIMPSFSNEFLYVMGTLLGNLNYYIIIAFFPITFALVEYIFVEFSSKSNR